MKKTPNGTPNKWDPLPAIDPSTPRDLCLDSEDTHEDGSHDLPSNDDMSLSERQPDANDTVEPVATRRRAGVRFTLPHEKSSTRVRFILPSGAESFSSPFSSPFSSKPMVVHRRYPVTYKYPDVDTHDPSAQTPPDGSSYGPLYEPPTPAAAEHYQNAVTSPSKFLDLLLYGRSATEESPALPGPSPTVPVDNSHPHAKGDHMVNPFIASDAAGSALVGISSHPMSANASQTRTSAPSPTGVGKSRFGSRFSPTSPSPSSSDKECDVLASPRFVPNNWRISPRSTRASDDSDEADEEGKTDIPQSLYERSRSTAAIARSHCSTERTELSMSDGDKETGHVATDLTKFGYQSDYDSQDDAMDVDSDDETASVQAQMVSDCSCTGMTHTESCPIYKGPEDCRCLTPTTRTHTLVCRLATEDANLREDWSAEPTDGNYYEGRDDFAFDYEDESDHFESDDAEMRTVRTPPPRKTNNRRGN